MTTHVKCTKNVKNVEIITILAINIYVGINTARSVSYSMIQTVHVLSNQ